MSATVATAVKTTNAKAAAAGFAAERSQCLQANVKRAFETYYGKPIDRIEQVSGKKHDTVVYFADKTQARHQNKNFSHADIKRWLFHQVNRRKLETVPFAFQGIASHVCLSRPKSRGRMKGVSRREFMRPYIVPSKNDSKSLIRLILLGEEEETPTHMTLTVSAAGVVSKLWIVPMESLLETLDADLYETPVCAKTTIAICSDISIQRKGGDKGAASADDIQFKLGFTEESMIRHKYKELALDK